ncbi:MAG: hypothetical protein HKN76_05030, partial [Saprospiraceae bacterium]|nr:hypothetical protein [Saprospiraceae bacterium]
MIFETVMHLWPIIRDKAELHSTAKIVLTLYCLCYSRVVQTLVHPSVFLNFDGKESKTPIMEHHRKLSDRDFLDSFENMTMNPAWFTHEAHLRVAYLYIGLYS